MGKTERACSPSSDSQMVKTFPTKNCAGEDEEAFAELERLASAVDVEEVGRLGSAEAGQEISKMKDPPKSQSIADGREIKKLEDGPKSESVANAGKPVQINDSSNSGGVEDAKESVNFDDAVYSDETYAKRLVSVVERALGRKQKRDNSASESRKEAVLEGIMNAKRARQEKESEMANEISLWG